MPVAAGNHTCVFLAWNRISMKVNGQEHAKRGFEAAAAGGRNVLIENTFGRVAGVYAIFSV